MEGEGLQGVLLDEALLFIEERGGAVYWQPDVAQFLCRLRYSNLSLGILSRSSSQDTKTKKEFLLQEIGASEVMRPVQLERGSSVREALMISRWGAPFTSSVYISSKPNESVEGDLTSQGWTILRVDSGRETGSLYSSVTSVHQVYEIPAGLALLNKRALADRLLVVGYTMKWTRELEFLKRGALPMLRNHHGLSFLPIQLERPLDQQLMAADIILHKATDEIVSVNAGQFGTVGSVQFSQGINELNWFLQEHPQICVVDPIERILPLLDRVATQAILKDLKIAAHQVIRPPRSVEVTTFEEPWLSTALSSENVGLPSIVKPRVACGASESHSMAVVFNQDGFKGLAVPLPATVQEYIDHGAFQYKMYVVGSKLLYSRRKSTPNASTLASRSNDSRAIEFDSLKSLPVDTDTEIPEFAGGDLGEFDLVAVQKAANWLRNKLGLTIIGFDVVVQAETKEYVIVDVNYFPSFKDVPDEEAIPAFWEALVAAHRQWVR